MRVYSDVVRVRIRINESVVVRGMERKQSWLAVWDAQYQATNATVFVGSGCAVATSYPVYSSNRSHPEDTVTARRRLQEKDQGTESSDYLVIVLLIGGLLCGCLACYYCLFCSHVVMLSCIPAIST